MDISSLLSPDNASQPASNPSSPARSSKATSRPASGERTASGLRQEILLEPHRANTSQINARNFTTVPSTSHAHGRPASRPIATKTGTTNHAFPARADSVAAPNFRQYQTVTSHPAGVLKAPYQQQQQQQQQHTGSSLPLQYPQPQTPPEYVPAHTHPLHERPVTAHRHSSTTSMETLADLASMQQRHRSTSQHAPSSPFRQSNRQHDHQHDSQTRSSTHVNASVTAQQPPLSRNLSGRSLTELIRDEAPTPTPRLPPPTMTSTALSEQELTEVNELTAQVHEKPHDRPAHVRLIGLLHQGFMVHLYPGGDAPPNDPRTYDLFTELRQARNTMGACFAVGEALFVEWISDEIVVARTFEERMEVVNLCEKALNDEPTSTKLWIAYLDYFYSTGELADGEDGDDTESVIETFGSAEDLENCKAIFDTDSYHAILLRAAEATKWRMDTSYLIWDRLLDASSERLPSNPSPEQHQQLWNIVQQSLDLPQMEFANTKAKCFGIIMKLFPNEYEAVAHEVNENTKVVERTVKQYDQLERNLQGAIESADDETTYKVYKEYIKYQSKGAHIKTVRDLKLKAATYERALLHFPTDVNWWIAYIGVVAQDKTCTERLAIIERATRHCPESGALWARRILRAEVEGMTYDQIEQIRISFTDSVLREAGGIDEYIKAWVGWCTYLRRYAFNAGADDDRFDTAEYGIVSAPEEIQQAGEKLLGDKYHGDPLFRVERIQLKFLSEARKTDEARQVLERLLPTHGTYAQYWLEFYQWEILQWGYQQMSSAHRVENAETGPHRATTLIEEALKRHDLDFPDKICDVYLKHFQLHESAEKLEVAEAKAFDFLSKIAGSARAQAKVAAPLTAEFTSAMEVDSGNSKRKRDRDDEEDESNHKKTRETQAEVKKGENEVARHREEMILVCRNLPVETEEVTVKQFFREICEPKSINLVQMNDGLTSSAVVEFLEWADVLSAWTRNGKPLFGGTGPNVQITNGRYSSLYCANFPPRYKESDVQVLFKRFGEIAGIRMPSLTHNDKRRFCYVQFLSNEVALAAEHAMDGTKLGTLELVAKVANPNAKNERKDAMSEGREIFMKNLPWTVKRETVADDFAKYGTIQRFNYMERPFGGFIGTCIIRYETADEAMAALEMNNKLYHGRVITVVIASKGGAVSSKNKARVDNHVIRNSDSATPAPSASTPAANGASLDTEMADGSVTDPAPTVPGQQAYVKSNERKLALMKLPATVNSERIQALLEPYGSILKIQTRRNLNGCIVEFKDVATVEKLRQTKIDCSDLGDEVKLAEVEELLALRPREGPGSGTFDRERDGFVRGGSKKPESSAPSRPSTIFQPSVVALRGRGRGGGLARGGRGGRGRGRGGGMGFKRGGGASAAARESAAADGAAADDASSAPKKDNNAFRQMFVKAAEPAAEQKDTEMKDQ